MITNFTGEIPIYVYFFNVICMSLILIEAGSLSVTLSLRIYFNNKALTDSLGNYKSKAEFSNSSAYRSDLLKIQFLNRQLASSERIS